MANVKIKLSDIEKMEIMTFKNGMTPTNVIKSYSPDYLINLGLYDMNTKAPLTKLKDENVKQGYLFSDLGFGIEDNKIEWNNNKLKDFISGSPTLLENGKVKIDWGNKYSEYLDGKHNRSAIGIDSQNIYLLVSDYALSIDSLASTCYNLGMKYAINLDGGGSSCLYIKNKFVKTSSRANTSYLLIWLKKGEEELIKQDLITNSTKRPKTKLNPTTLTIHSTGNLNSTAQNERDWLMNKSNTSSTSWHVCVDEKEAIQAIPFNEVAYHSGSTKGNNSSIGLEICESGNRNKTLQNAILVTAEILNKYGWDTSNLRQHNDWNGKNCPRILRDTGKWNWFKEEVEKELERVAITRNKIEFMGKEIDGFILNSESITYAPIREIAETLGLKVGYNNATKKVTLSK